MREGITAPEAQRQEQLLRRKKRLAMQYRRRRIRLGIGVVVFFLVIASVIVAISYDGPTAQADTQNLLAGTSPSASAPVTSTGQQHPAFARLGDRNLTLPVDAGDATIIAYQPITDERALELTPIGEKANTNAIVRFFRDIFAGEPLLRYHQLEGGGSIPTSSVLIGAPAGSPVTSPVSGTVTAVKEYKLYGKYDDVQIDIRLEELSGTTVSLMFISDPAVSIGEVVSAGKTQLGRVRESPSELAATITRYTHDSGAHVNLKVTEEPAG